MRSAPPRKEDGVPRRRESAVRRDFFEGVLQARCWLQRCAALDAWPEAPVNDRRDRATFCAAVRAEAVEVLPTNEKKCDEGRHVEEIAVDTLRRRHSGRAATAIAGGLDPTIR